MKGERMALCIIRRERELLIWHKESMGFLTHPPAVGDA